MKKYRIIKVTKSNTNKTYFYIEKFNKFLWFKWWSKVQERDFRWNKYLKTFHHKSYAENYINMLLDVDIEEVVGNYNNDNE